MRPLVIENNQPCLFFGTTDSNVPSDVGRIHEVSTNTYTCDLLMCAPTKYRKVATMPLA